MHLLVCLTNGACIIVICGLPHLSLTMGTERLLNMSYVKHREVVDTI